MANEHTTESKEQAQRYFEQALKRPIDYPTLSADDQWLADRKLGILDWDGSCEHQREKWCKKCWQRYRDRASHVHA